MMFCESLATRHLFHGFHLFKYLYLFLLFICVVNLKLLVLRYFIGLLYAFFMQKIMQVSIFCDVLLCIREVICHTKLWVIKYGHVTWFTDFMSEYHYKSTKPHLQNWLICDFLVIDHIGKR